MKIDKILEFSFNRTVGAFASQNYNQSPITHVMVTSESIRPTNSDQVSIKLRTPKTTMILVDSLNMGQLDFMSNFRYGLNNAQLGASQNKAIDDLFSSAGITDLATQKASWETRKRYSKKPLACLVPVGHLTLAGNYELEISVRASAVAGYDQTETIKVYGVHTKQAPDHVLLHDSTGDNDATMGSVREIYAVSNDASFIKSDGNYMDIRYEVKTPNFNSSASVEDYLAATAVFGNFEDQFTSMGCKLVAFEDELPEDQVRVKTLGSDMNQSTVVYIKETLLAETSDSTLQNLEKLRDRVKELERKDAQLAKEYRHAGVIPKSEELDLAVEVIEQGKKRDGE